MVDTVDYTDVPYLQEILNFLPINPDDEEDVINYVQNITNVVAVNYKYSQYQFPRRKQWSQPHPSHRSDQP